MEGGVSSRKRQTFFIEKLLDWYELNGRIFSWRERTLTPYEVLVLEILLQRTPAERVDKIFPKFIKKYPGPRALLKSSKRFLVSDLKTLGLRKRVKNLKELARQLVKEWKGRVPKDVDKLTKLPGVGIYAANAVLCFSYGKVVPLVDTNVARVLQRVFALPSSGDPNTDKHLWTFVRELLPATKAKEFNWALIDFGAVVCRPKNPLCNECSMLDFCSYRQQLAFIAEGHPNGGSSRTPILNQRVPRQLFERLVKMMKGFFLFTPPKRVEY